MFMIHFELIFIKCETEVEFHYLPVRVQLL